MSSDPASPESPSSPQRKHKFDDAPGIIGFARDAIPPLPDDALTNRTAGHIDPRQWFSNPAAPFELEIGSGKGTFLVEQCPRSPGTNFLGIEWEYEFYLYSADRLRRRALTNVRMLCTNGADFLKWRVPDSIVSVIHLYYSDPWPKTKHHKNRVIQHAFLADCWRVLKPGGELRVVTDHDELWEWDQEHFADWLARENTPFRRGTPAPSAELTHIRTLQNPPFTSTDFVPVDWVGDGGVVGTNYERKMTTGIKQPHAAVLRKPLAVN